MTTETIRTLGALKRAPGGAFLRLSQGGVKDELRNNLLARLRARQPVFPGVVGYDDTVVPQLVNAILSKHNFILLGLRGQAKSRILRALTTLLDPGLPAIAGCEIHDNPVAPICARCRRLVATVGDDTPIEFLVPEQRYVEKLATPDVTMADLIGDLDPIKAARTGLDLADEMTIFYGLLPRANRGIFAVNELPDLAGKIQVGLFNIMQEGDVQIKGYPLRLPLDVALVFSANPEDYTARGKIVTPLKDRIGSEIRTHYPMSLEEGLQITAQEADVQRNGTRLEIPGFVREVVESIAFVARDDKRVDKRSGVSQRLPISCLENVVSSAERRALVLGEALVVPRVTDVFNALPSVTGKLELEYEGEMRGPEVVARDLVRLAVGRVFDRYFDGANLHRVVQFFELGGHLQLEEETPTATCLDRLRQINGLDHHLAALKIDVDSPPALQLAGAEFILEGLYAHRRISRSEKLGFHSEEKRRPTEPERARDDVPGMARRRPLN